MCRGWEGLRGDIPSQPCLAATEHGLGLREKGRQYARHEAIASGLYCYRDTRRRGFGGEISLFDARRAVPEFPLP